jgi:hypothetical protein
MVRTAAPGRSGLVAYTYRISLERAAAPFSARLFFRASTTSREGERIGALGGVAAKACQEPEGDSGDQRERRFQRRTGLENTYACGRDDTP